MLIWINRKSYVSNVNEITEDYIIDNQKADCVLDDDSELGKKYKELFPNVIVTTDDEGNIIDVSEDTEVLNKIDIANQIASLKEQLSEGDYKIIKCYEANLKNEEMPYDINALIAERDMIRGQINSLEILLI